MFQRILRMGERYVWESNQAPLLARALNTVDAILANAPAEASIDDILELRYSLADAVATRTRVRAEYERMAVA